LVVVVGYPFLRGIQWSFTDFYLLKGLTDWNFIGLENYVKFIRDPKTPQFLINSVIWVTASLALQSTLGLTLALLLNRPMRFRGIYRALVLVPWVTPTVVAALIWRWILHEQWGVVNLTLMRVGVIDQPIRWLSDTTLVWISLLVMAAWRFVPFWYVNILAGLQTIPREMYDAAAIDGAGRVGSFWHITLPFLRPVLGVLFLLETVWRANEFSTIWVMTEGGPAGATTTLAILTYQTGFLFYRIGYAASMGVSLTIMLAFFAWYYIRRVRMEA
jgi:multiple sugar transport system permease protein